MFDPVLTLTHSPNLPPPSTSPTAPIDKQAQLRAELLKKRNQSAGAAAKPAAAAAAAAGGAVAVAGVVQAPPAAKKSRVEPAAKVAGTAVGTAAAAAAAGTEMSVDEVVEGGAALAAGTGTGTGTGAGAGAGVGSDTTMDSMVHGGSMEIEEGGQPVAEATEQPPSAVPGHATRYALTQTNPALPSPNTNPACLSSLLSTHLPPSNPHPPISPTDPRSPCLRLP